MKEEQPRIPGKIKMGTFRTTSAKDRKTLKNFSAATLKRIAKTNGLPTSGSKETILQRLSGKKVKVHVNIEFIETTT